MTHTHAILEVSPRTYREIREKLLAAGYQDHCKQSSGEDADVIDLHGLALREAEAPAVPREAFVDRTGAVWADRGGRRFVVRSVRDGVVTLYALGSEVFSEHSPGEFCPTPEFPQGFHGYRFVSAGPK